MVLALLTVLVMPTAALAGNPTTVETTVSGQVAYTYTLEAPTSVSLGTLSQSSAVTSVVQTITASTGDPAMHYVTLKAEDRNPLVYGTGCLRDTTNYLDPPLEIKSSKAGWSSFVGLNSAHTADIQTLSSSVLSANDVLFQQPAIDGAKKLTDGSPLGYVPAGNYSITVKFTATFS